MLYPNKNVYYLLYTSFLNHTIQPLNNTFAGIQSKNYVSTATVVSKQKCFDYIEK